MSIYVLGSRPKEKKKANVCPGIVPKAVADLARTLPMPMASCTRCIFVAWSPPMLSISQDNARYHTPLGDFQASVLHGENTSVSPEVGGVGNISSIRESWPKTRLSVLEACVLVAE